MSSQVWMWVAFNAFVLVMLAVDGLTIPEIAGILEIPEGTVKSRIFYARKRLKETLQIKKKNQ